MARKKEVVYENAEINTVLGVLLFVLAIVVLLSFFAPIGSGTFLDILKSFIGIGVFPLSFWMLNLSLKKLGFSYLFNENSPLFFQFFSTFFITSLQYLNFSETAKCTQSLSSIKLDKIISIFQNCHIGYFLGNISKDALGLTLARVLLVILTLIILIFAFNLSLAAIWVYTLKILEFISKVFSSIYNQIKLIIEATRNFIEHRKSLSNKKELENSSQSEIEIHDNDITEKNSRYWQKAEANEMLANKQLQLPIDQNGANVPNWKKIAQGKVLANIKDDELQSEDLENKNLNKKTIKFIENENNNSIQENQNSDENDLTSGLAALQQNQELEALRNSVLQFEGWLLPPISELDKYELQKQDRKEIMKNADIIEHSFRSFGINVKVQRELCKIGPSVSQYVIAIAEGVSVGSISKRDKDLKSHLSAVGEIRIQQIDGTPYIGIEVPNIHKTTVSFREMMEALGKTYKNYKLGVVLGKAIDGTPVIYDLQKMPHLLIAGTTGSGKSVLTNTLLMSLLMTKTPDELRLIIVDPKKVDFADYDGIPHLLTPLITGETEKVMNAIKWAVEEMDRRYTVLAEARVKNIAEYNEQLGFSALPYIVIIIDEVADLMMTTGKAFEGEVTRIAQKARAVGIHLILATQRPSVNVITGILKGNLPAHVALRVNSNIDSRVVLDQPGAENLLGNGDMLAQIESNKVRRLQGAFIDGKEIKRVVAFIKEQYESFSNEPNYLQSIGSSQKWDPSRKSFVEYSADSNGSNSESEVSDTNLESLKLFKRLGKASASLLQTHMKIGYNKSSRMIAELQELGYLGENLGGTKGYTINWDLVNATLQDSNSEAQISANSDSIYGDDKLAELEGIASVSR